MSPTGAVSPTGAAGPASRTASRETGRATVAGHVCVDLVPRLAGIPPAEPGALVEVGPLALRAGGCVANTGRALAALGTPVRLVADVGDDTLAATLRELLAGTGADVTGLRRVDGAGTSYSIVLDTAGRDRTVWHHVGANAGFDGGRVDPAATDLVHLGYPSVLPALSADGGGALRSLLRRCRSAGATTSVDLATIDPRSPAGELDWRTILAAVLPATDVFSPSLDDLTSALPLPAVTGPGRIAELGRELVSLGAAVVMLTAGRAGMYLFTGGASRLAAAGRGLVGEAAGWAGVELHEPSRAVRVVATTGAGDAATAGLLHGILTGLGPEGALACAADAAAAQVSGRAAGGG